MELNHKICLNVGCGLDAPDQWLNIDASPSLRISKLLIVGKMFSRVLNFPKWPSSVQCGDLIKGIRGIKPGSCELIFASHILEHLSFRDLHTALERIYVYLQPGGTARVIVPDLKKCVSVYLKELENNQHAGQAAVSFMKNSGLGQEESQRNLYQKIRHSFGHSQHKWLWDFPSLSLAFKEHGFVKIRLCTYGDWCDDRFKFVESKERHIDAICLEAVKKA